MINIILDQNNSEIYNLEAGDLNQDGIIDTIDEFILRINGNWVEPNDERELNERFWNILKGWKSSDVIQVPFHAYHNEKMLCEVGYNYLKANQNWLLK